MCYIGMSPWGDNVAKVRISIVEYLNTAPLVWGFTNGPLRERYHLSFTVPSLCAEALRSGQADIAIIPAIEYQRMEGVVALPAMAIAGRDRKSTRLNSSHLVISYAVFCLKKKK